MADKETIGSVTSSAKDNFAFTDEFQLHPMFTGVITVTVSRNSGKLSWLPEAGETALTLL